MPASALVLSWAAPDLTTVANASLVIAATPPISPGRRRVRPSEFRIIAKLPTSGLIDGHSLDITAAWSSAFGLSITAATLQSVFVRVHLINSKGAAGPRLIAAARFLASAFSPYTLPGLNTRLDASVLSTLWQNQARTIPITASGQPVGSWDTIGTATGPFSRSPGGTFPTWVNAGPGPIPHVRSHTDTTEYLRTAVILDYPQPITVYMAVANIGLHPGTQLVPFDCNHGSAHDFKIDDASTIPTKWQLDAGTALLGANAIAPAIITAVFNGPTSSVSQNDVLGATGNAGANSWQSGKLFGNRFANLWADAGLCEVLVYSAAHDAPTQTQVVSFLRAKWAI